MKKNAFQRLHDAVSYARSKGVKELDCFFNGGEGVVSILSRHREATNDSGSRVAITMNGKLFRIKGRIQTNDIYPSGVDFPSRLTLEYPGEAADFIEGYVSAKITKTAEAEKNQDTPIAATPSDQDKALIVESSTIAAEPPITDVEPQTIPQHDDTNSIDAKEMLELMEGDKVITPPKDSMNSRKTKIGQGKGKGKNK